ncbi:hypothetical protein Ciccas_002953 [Cichlidogyrus casuarinus]|uniref:AAA+ ATPase domain-containing protein n=1 Tax=Cichlidogyrus casuarinus TaxID=1844966 RepID=A0ABD2QFR8_9PLAT
MAIESIRLKEFSEFLNPKSDFTGTTALHYAALMDDMILIKRLLAAGANPLATNSKNHTPKLYAKNHAVLNLLNEAERNELKKLKRKKLDVPIEEIFKKHVIGQKEALKTVAGAIRRMEMGWQNADHPLVFLFLGSSGIGKTELAKQIAAYLHPDEQKAFIRIDMSEYQQKHEVSKLIGSPPGYIGHEQGGQLTQALAAYPDAVVLFDEMEKAHPDVMTILLQLFDEGRLTDGKGRTIACKEAVFIMTSNVGSQAIAEYVRDHRPKDDSNFEISKDFKEGVMRPLLRRHFVRDEFLGRVNEMVYFVPFSQGELKQILSKILHFWKEKALKDHGIKLSWENCAVDLLLEGYDVYFGARSLQYEVERKVVNQLVVAEMKNEIGEGSSVELVAQTGANNKKFLALKITDRSRLKDSEIVHMGDSLASTWTSEKKATS